MKSLFKPFGYFACFAAFLSAALLPACAPRQDTAAPAAPPVQARPAAPVISALTADAQVAISAKTKVTCTAAGSVGSLSYTWSASGGVLEGAGDSVTWTAPARAGDYTITVSVSDGSGATTRKEIVINVPQKPNSPPVITALRFTRPGRLPITIKPNMTDEEKRKLPDPVAVKFNVCDISCAATDVDGDKLEYVWQASGGKITGTGPDLQWIAAGEPGLYTVTVSVTDNKGGRDSFQIAITVHCCN